jgi:hypothetical protein
MVKRRLKSVSSSALTAVQLNRFPAHVSAEISGRIKVTPRLWKGGGHKE